MHSTVAGGYLPEDAGRAPDDCYTEFNDNAGAANCPYKYAYVMEVIDPGKHGYCKLCFTCAKDYIHAFPDWFKHTRLWTRDQWETSGREAEIESIMKSRVN